MNFNRAMRTLTHWTLWLVGAYLLALFVFCNQAFMASMSGAAHFTDMFKTADVSVFGVALAIAFFGANRTLGNFTFSRAFDDMAENARNNPRSYDWLNDSSPRMGISPYTGESGPSGSCDSQGNVIP